MARIFNVANNIGFDVRSRSAAEIINSALKSDFPPVEISFAGVRFISRSFTDELCAILDSSPAVQLSYMSPAVENMFTVVRSGRERERIRPKEGIAVKSFENIKELSAFMRKQK